MAKYQPITPGAKFGRWTALDKTETRIYPSGASTHFRMCRCDCGNSAWVGENKLRIGHSRSCGCLKSEVTEKRSLKHGHSKRGKRTRAYGVWRNMISRCTNPNVGHYYRYGGRGITICDRWMVFENFLDDMGQPPKGFTIDRIDNDDGYFKENCAWKTPLDQALNRGGKRKIIRIAFDGLNLTIKEWAKKLGVNHKMLGARYHAGWSTEEILTVDHKLKI